MQIEKASNPSFSWRSIQAAKYLIQNGLRKTIGNGADTSVWSDPWIPDSSPRPARPSTYPQDPYLKVGHLIDHESKQWNLQLAYLFLNGEDVKLLQTLRISPTNRKDSYSWDHTKSGVYTVRACYQVAIEMRKQHKAQPIEEPSTTSLIAHIWKIKTARKIKHLVWQALSGFLPAANRLVDRHCGTDRVCQRCGAEEETINHIFFECPPAIQVWALSSIPSNPGVFPSSALYCNFDYLFWRAREQGATNQALESFPWTIWYIWKARNAKVFEGKDISPEYTAQLAEHETQVWKIAQCSEEIEEEEISPPEPQVELETENITKWRCRTDASWTAEANYTGLGFTMQEGNRLIMTGARGCAKLKSPLKAEFEALLWAMQEMKERNLKDILFETDCEQLTRLIDKEEEWPAMAAELDAFKVLRSDLHGFRLSHISRSLNIGATLLQKGHVHELRLSLL